MDDAVFRQILDRLAEGIHIVDLNGETSYYNRAMGRMEGLDPQVVIGKGLLSHFPSLSQETSTLWQVLRTQEPVLQVTQTYLNPRGERITSVNDTYPLFEDGRFVGAMEVARDLSREASLSEKVSELQTELFTPKGLKEKKSLRSKLYYTFADVKTRSQVMLDVLAKARRAAASEVNILISGETGTGKEMVAQSIHTASIRAQKPFVAQNCAAFPEGLLEGLLFGTARGSFTGAIDRPGLFEQADGGTLLLDELDSMGWNLQAKLLRVIQEGKVRRLGATREKQIEVRVLATTNGRAEEALKDGKIRPDLFYRLSVLNLHLPPLRARQEDLGLLTGHFLEYYALRQGRKVPHLQPTVMELFRVHDWPGNVRELAHVIEGGLIIADAEFGPEELPYYLRALPSVRAQAHFEVGKAIPDVVWGELSLPERLECLERESIQAALAASQGNLTKAARLLGISRQLLQYKLKNLGLKSQDGRKDT